MRIADYQILPDVAPEAVPLWRQIARGFSQCAFQTNELTALFFIAGVATYNWLMAVFYVLSVILGTLVARAVGGSPTLLGLGLYGFNSGLMGLALGSFFVVTPVLWVWVVVLAVVVGLASVILSRLLPMPFIAAPFISVFWVIWPLKEFMGIAAIDLGAFPEAPVQIGLATISALGSALFAGSVTTGLLFLIGVAVSEWRHALAALIGALLAATLASHVGAVGAAINSGFIGFNAVLAAIAVFALIAPDLRLACLAALFATWFFSIVFRHWPLPVLASGFVVSVWFILLLGWLNPRLHGLVTSPQPDQEPGTASG